jgi:hypothetical protein
VIVTPEDISECDTRARSAEISMTGAGSLRSMESLPLESL